MRRSGFGPGPCCVPLMGAVDTGLPVIGGAGAASLMVADSGRPRRARRSAQFIRRLFHRPVQRDTLVAKGLAARHSRLPVGKNGRLVINPHMDFGVGVKIIKENRGEKGKGGGYLKHRARIDASTSVIICRVQAWLTAVSNSCLDSAVSQLTGVAARRHAYRPS